MTGTTAHPTGTRNAVRAAQLMLALAVGASAGSVVTLQLVNRIEVSGPTNPDVVASASRATTTATEQYVGWYTRPAGGPGAWMRETQQYVDWFMRPSDVGIRTTATEQYVQWYLRDSQD